MGQHCKVALIQLFTTEYHCPALHPIPVYFQSIRVLALETGKVGDQAAFFFFEPVVQFAQAVL